MTVLYFFHIHRSFFYFFYRFSFFRKFSIKILSCCLVVLLITASTLKILGEALLNNSQVLRCFGVYKKDIAKQEGLKKRHQNNFWQIGRLLYTNWVFLGKFEKKMERRFVICYIKQIRIRLKIRITRMSGGIVGIGRIVDLWGQRRGAKVQNMAKNGFIYPCHLFPTHKI